MNNKKQDIDSLSRELLKKSIVRPESSDFDKILMEKIQISPSPTIRNSNAKNIQKGWLFLIVAVICVLTTAAIIGEFSTGYYHQASIALRITINWVFYGGMALSIPLVLYYFDSLLQAMISNRRQNLFVN